MTSLEIRGKKSLGNFSDLELLKNLWARSKNPLIWMGGLMVPKKTMVLLIIVSLLVISCAPTLTESRENYVKAHPNLDPRMKEAILRGDVVVGMTQDDVTASCGSPNLVTSGVGKGGELCNYWGYKRYTVTFGENGKVKEVK